MQNKNEQSYLFNNKLECMESVNGKFQAGDSLRFILKILTEKTEVCKESAYMGKASGHMPVIKKISYLYNYWFYNCVSQQIFILTSQEIDRLIDSKALKLKIEDEKLESVRV
tara:strand:- start:1193 stop:1528 length:336 start_codon:yes stop_codon:yes gene_type:complete